MVLLIAIIAGVVALDQLTKWLAVVYLQGEASFPLWQDVLHFTFVKNEGAAFGMLKDSRWVFMIFSSVAIIALLVFLFRFPPKSRWMQISIAMIIGGGIGNMIDRIFLGYVIDFIDFTLIDFAVFNVADSFVTVGSFLMIFLLIAEMIKEERQARKLKRETAESAVEASAETSAESAKETARVDAEDATVTESDHDTDVE